MFLVGKITTNSCKFIFLLVYGRYFSRSKLLLDGSEERQIMVSHINGIDYC